MIRHPIDKMFTFKLNYFLNEYLNTFHGFLPHAAFTGRPHATECTHRSGRQKSDLNQVLPL